MKQHKRVRHGHAALCALLLFSAVDSWAAEEPDEADPIYWLSAMHPAVSSLTYHGVFAYLRSNTVESMQVFHAVTDGVERERLLSLNGPMREVVRDAEKVMTFLPDTRMVIVDNKPPERSFLFSIPKDLKQLTGLYRFSLGCREHVAQKPAQVVVIEPNDRFRYTRKIWIDVESKLPLKFELIDDKRSVIEQVVFTELNVRDAIGPDQLQASTKPEAYTWHVNRHEALPIDSLHWTLTSVPEGFQLVSYTRLLPPAPGKAVDHILLSDGFSSVSIYIEEKKADVILSQPKQFGAVHTYARLVDSFLVTIMGEVPMRTVEMIGTGIKFQETASR